MALTQLNGGETHKGNSNSHESTISEAVAPASCGALGLATAGGYMTMLTILIVIILVHGPSHA